MKKTGFLFLVLSFANPVNAEPLEFHLRFSPKVSAKPFSGRIYVLLSKSRKSLPSGPNWFKPEPFFATDVTDWRPGTWRKITVDDLGFPVRLNKIPGGKYYIHAVMDFNKGARSFSTAEGNGYCRPNKKLLDPEIGPVKLLLDQVYEVPPLPSNDRVKIIKMKSGLLSKFHNRPVFMKAAIILPKSYDAKAHHRYPTIYAIPGFSGTYRRAFTVVRRNPTEVAGKEFLYVILDPSCKWGHHVFANSENNGPWGSALTQEFIPYIEANVRAINQPYARLLTGHSSGGWSSLWLQITYPDFFGGTWSTAPDPVDFRDFQRVNIYNPGENAFFDSQGKLRPLARKGKKILFHYKTFSEMEEVMGHGGQLGSFEAVFSPKGEDGRPLKLWDRKTGEINPAVAEHWKRYDIRLILERNWQTLGPNLTGKIHVYMGSEDNFYLDGAVRLLKNSLDKLKSGFIVEIFSGRDHGNLLSTSLRRKIAQDMARQVFRSRNRIKEQN